MKTINKKKIGVVVFFVTILTLVSIFKASIPIKQMFAAEPKAAAQARPDSIKVIDKNILSNVDIYSLVKTGLEVKLQENGSMIPNGGHVRTEWHLDLPQTSQIYKKGDTFEIPVPKEFEIEESGEGPMLDENKQETAYYIVDKEKQQIRIILTTDVVQAKYKVTTRAYVKYHDTSEAMLKNIEFNTIKRKQIYKLSVPKALDIALPDTKVVLLDANGQETTRMPVKFKVEYWTNQYSYNLSNYAIYNSASVRINNIPKKIISESIKVVGRQVDMSGNKLTGTDDKEIPSNQYKVNLEDTDNGNNNFIRFNSMFFDMVKVSYDVEVDYTNFVPGPGAKYGTTYFDSDVKGANLVDYYPNVKKDMSNRGYSQFDIDYVKDRRFIYLADLNTTQGNTYFQHEISAFINGDEELLKQGTEFTVEGLRSSADYNEHQYYNAIKGLKVLSSEAKIIEGKVPSFSSFTFQESDDWEIKDSGDGKSVKLIYKGPNTNKTYALKFKLGVSNKGDVEKYTINGVYQMSGLDYAGSLQKEQNSFFGKGYVSSRAYQPSLYTETEDELVFGLSNVFNKFGINTNHMNIKNFNIELLPFKEHEYNFIRGIKSAKLIGYSVKDEPRELIQGEDFEIHIEGNKKVVVEMLKETNDSIGGEITFDFDMSKLEEIPFEWGKPAKGYMEERGTGLKRHASSMSYQIDERLYSNNPVIHSVDDNEVQDEDSGGLPYTKQYYVLNPKKRITKKGKVEINSSEALLNEVPIFYKGDATKSVKFYKYKQKYNHRASFNEFKSNLEAIDQNSPLFSVISNSEKQGTIQINQDLDETIVVETMLQTKNPSFETRNRRMNYKYFNDNEVAAKEATGFVSILSMTKGTVSMEQNEQYENAVNLDVKIPKSKLTSWPWELNENMMFKVFIKPENIANFSVVNMLTEVRDGDGKELPRDSVSISRVMGTNNNAYFEIKLKDKFINVLQIRTILSTKESQKITLNQDGQILTINDNSDPFIKRPLSVQSKTINIITSPTSGAGYLVATDANIKVIDGTSNKGLSGAEFKLIDRVTGQEFDVGPSDAYGNINIIGILVSDYYLKQTKSPAGYDLSPEYSEENGKPIVLVEDKTQNTIVVKLGSTSSVNVHFSYKDHSPIDGPQIEPIKIIHPKGSPLNLSANELVKKAKVQMTALKDDYRYIGFDSAGVSGGETNLILSQDTQDVYYQYEGLVSIKGPEALNFNKGKVSPFNQKLSTKFDNPLKLIVRDNRQINPSSETNLSKTRGNISIQAHVSKNFIGDTYQDELKKIQTVYLDKGIENILNGNGSEVARSTQNISSPNRKDFEFILEEKTNPNKGFKLNVTPGEVKAQNYTGELSFDLVQGP